jgi:Tol biopolymer transport system component
VTKTIDLATGESRRITASAGRLELNPAWNGDHELTIGSVDDEGGSDAVSVDAAGGLWPVTRSDDTADLPLAWSPDGKKLAARSVETASASGGGASYVELMSADGERERVSDSADALIVGWKE